jgi:hypothetical protein
MMMMMLFLPRICNLLAHFAVTVSMKTKPSVRTIVEVLHHHHQKKLDVVVGVV